MKRTLSLLILFSMLLSSCSSGNTANPDDPKDTADAQPQTETAETEPVPAIPDELSFGGREFRLLTGSFREYCNVTKEDYTGEVLNDTIYDMELNTESRLNVKITEEYTDVVTANQTAVSLVSSGDETYAAMNQLDRFTVSLMLEGALHPMDDTPYIDFDASWWNPAVTEQMSLGGQTYFVSSASNVLMYANTSCVFVNTDLAKNLGINTETLYDQVRDGTWTQEQMMEYAALATSDLDGDGEMTTSDRYGLICLYHSLLGTSFITAGGANSIDKNSEDKLTPAWNSELYTSLAENAYNIYNGDDISLLNGVYDPSAFVSNRALFMHGIFVGVDYISEMESNYTIVPIPKYDAAQENYISANYDVMTYCLPKFVNDTEFAGAVLEWLSYEGKMNVEDAFIETTMKYKAARDETMAEMVQICLDTSMIDLGSIYAYDYCSYDHIYYDVLRAPSFALASYIAGRAEALQTLLDDIHNAVNGITETAESAG